MATGTGWPWRGEVAPRARAWAHLSITRRGRRRGPCAWEVFRRPHSGQFAVTSAPAFRIEPGSGGRANRFVWVLLAGAHIRAESRARAGRRVSVLSQDELGDAAASTRSRGGGRLRSGRAGRGRWLGRDNRQLRLPCCAELEGQDVESAVFSSVLRGGLSMRGVHGVSECQTRRVAPRRASSMVVRRIGLRPPSAPAGSATHGCSRPARWQVDHRRVASSTRCRR